MCRNLSPSRLQRTLPSKGSTCLLSGQLFSTGEDTTCAFSRPSSGGLYVGPSCLLSALDTTSLRCSQRHGDTRSVMSMLRHEGECRERIKEKP